jgi:glycosyltransferase involved in cell wall biosynthesis
LVCQPEAYSRHLSEALARLLSPITGAFVSQPSDIPRVPATTFQRDGTPPTSSPLASSMQPKVSVLLCTHNPRIELLQETINALAAQSAFDGAWELVIIDNASDPALGGRDDLLLPKNARIVVEPKLGLTHARRRSFEESSAEILVYVDDDNVLQPDYLATAYAIMKSDSELGAVGGKVLPRYEVQPPAWFAATGISLACRDLGSQTLSASWKHKSQGGRQYPDCSPIGAGMVLRRDAYAAYVKETAEDSTRLALGRRGNDLASGEDNDMVMTLLRDGWTVGYEPELVLQHIIPESRLTKTYLRRYAYSSNRTWVQVLAVHGMTPWSELHPATALLRKARAYVRSRAWRGPVEAIAWASACGLIDGRARIRGIGNSHGSAKR